MSLIVLSDWLYRQAGTELWKKSKPGSTTQIHADLLHNKEIPDPFLDMNEKEIQWVGETDWEYKSEFFVEKNLEFLLNLVLFFDGLDTFATVILNGTQILKSDNMYAGDKVDVKHLLKYGENNTLTIKFESALLIARQLEKENGKFVCWNGETCRLHIRKAPYHFGWDWGPIIMTCGPYRPVHLELFNVRIEDFHVDVEVSDQLDVDLNVEIEVTTTTEVGAKVEIFSPDNILIATEYAENVNEGTFSVPVHLLNPALWYPHTIGTPHLHKFKVSLQKNDKEVSQAVKIIGLRKIELVQESLEEGLSFYFKCNYVPVYCAGANWIPAHSILTLLTSQDYTDWLQLAKNGNLNMIRVWGGGYYEENVFYSECDRLGLLVWQDFMFACGQYPGDTKFIESIEREAEVQLKRLRTFCCLALFAGNNEDYQIAETYKLEWDRTDYSENYSLTNFPARTIYEKTLPDLVKKYLPSVPYHPGSPWSGEHPTTDQTIGDLHQWNVWHGTQEKYQDWYKLGGRFVSEFGMEALPSIKTYRECITDHDQLYPQSEYVDHHNKADGFERRLALYVVENIKITDFSLDSWIYATQLMQAECLAYAYKCWRRKWKNNRERLTGGALVWQLNDCWPVASWAIVDFYRRPKLAYYAIKRESQPVSLGLFRNEIGEKAEIVIGAPHDYLEKKFTLDVWGANSGLTDVYGYLTVDLYEATSGEKIETIISGRVTVLANGSTDFKNNLNLPHGKVIAYAFLVAANGELIASGSDWPQPLKYLNLKERKVKLEVSENLITLSSDKPVKGVEILLERDLALDDNGFDLFPGHVKKVRVAGLSESDKVQLRYYQS